MARLLPIQGETEVPDAGPRVVDLEGEDADAVFSALSSDTARDIYRTLQEEPHAPSEIAEAADTSIQNVRYHLDNLEQAGLIEVVDTWYSSRGNEMSVYAPTSDALVLASGEEQTSRLRTAISRLVGGVVVLALASLAFQRAAKDFVGGKIGLGGAGPGGSGAGESPESYEFAADGGDGGDGGDASERLGGDNLTGGEDQAATTKADGVGIMDADTTTPAPEETGTAVEKATETATEAAAGTETPMPTGTPAPQETAAGTPPAEAERTLTEYANATLDQAARETTTATDAVKVGNEAAQAGGLPPGLVFFVGGAVVLVSVVAYLYWKGA
ncbi:MAG: DNA-binding transcriptional ArsR family regulator [Halobacteriales archaeon]|jgi:DNA-binding transcriptional ArsR family regulator